MDLGFLNEAVTLIGGIVGTVGGILTIVEKTSKDKQEKKLAF